MSFWSAIGLADRDTVNSLLAQLQAVREENRRLLEDNQKLLMLHHETLTSRADQLSEGMGQLEADISAQGNSVKRAVSDASETLQAANEALYKNLSERLGSETDIIKRGQTKLQQHMEENQELFVRQVNEQFGRLQNLFLERLQRLEKGQTEIVQQIAKKCAEGAKRLEETVRNYDQFVRTGEKYLDQMEGVSGEFSSLAANQNQVMERLSRLCEDSDQFMEIQKSINDMWEIMKVVWVDSLLNEFEKAVDGENTV